MLVESPIPNLILIGNPIKPIQNLEYVQCTFYIIDDNSSIAI